MIGKVPDKIIAKCLLLPENLTKKQIDEIRLSYKEIGRDSFFKQGRKHKILPYLAHSLMFVDCDASFWNNIHEHFFDRNRKIIGLLEIVFEALNKEGVTKVCVAENFASVLISNSCIGCFSSGDVDLYCDDLNIDMLDYIMKSLGFTWSDRHTRKKMFAREYKSIDAIGEEFWLNFQWKPMTRKKTHLYDQRYILKRYNELFDEVVYYKDTNIRMFSPDVAMYLNCIHIASGHFYILSPGIRLYIDIDRPARACVINWERVRNWIESDNLGLRGNIVFELSKLQLRTPIPHEAFTNSINKQKEEKLLNSLINSEKLEFKIPKKSKIQYIKFLIRVELSSDGKNILQVLSNRFWVILTDWN